MEEEVSLLRSIRSETEKSMRSIDLAAQGLEDLARRSLLQQRQEYARIAQSAERLLLERGQPWIEKRRKRSAALWDLRSVERQQLLLENRRRDSRDGLKNSLRSVGQMRTVDPKVAALNRRLLLTRQADAEQMERFF